MLISTQSNSILKTHYKDQMKMANDPQNYDVLKEKQRVLRASSLRRLRYEFIER